jgi:hypothetical protein
MYMSRPSQFFAPCPASSVDDFPAISCFHALAESMHSFAASFAGLICAFHWITYS